MTLATLKGKTPGFDKVSYPMLKHLPINTLSILNSIIIYSLQVSYRKAGKFQQ